ncbi:hypothetical protein DNI29_14295 [Hymenobacter sediminis]|uniref:alginate O-acetyltransferase AlgX-related protein n=1 Tax=Hymenobacter sediminis TaxID=2218621 RepID=UPI000DA68DDB|nr:hypothetical protein [Hymenobacter sediminis]RPD46173.1 hypothetical protein DNI29_14295 [Hymenobacter sediminis]
MKHAVFALLFALLLVPALQAKFKWVTETPLDGAYTTAPRPSLTLPGLLENTVQPRLEQYLEDRLGFRTWLIRLRNQLSFSLFHVARSSDLLVGRDLVLFQPGPSKAYRGDDYLGEEEIQFQVQRMAIVQQELAKRHIPMLFVMAPNKARFQPEDLPAHYRNPENHPTNYPSFLRQLTAAGIPTLDAHALFQQWKDTSRYPLFPKGGTHWSAYGATLVADTLFRSIEQLGKFDLADFRQVGRPVILRDSLRKTDADLSGALNLIFPYRPYPAAYPTIVFDSLRAKQQRPNLLIVGDSFTWQFMQFTPYLQTLFSPDSRFWYYNKTVFLFRDDYTQEGHQPQQLNLQEEIHSRQFLLFIVTEHNLAEREFGFIDDLYHLYFPYSEADRARISQLEQQLMTSPQYEQRLWQEVHSGNWSLVEELHQQAVRQYDRQLRLN